MIRALLLSLALLAPAAARADAKPGEGFGSLTVPEVAALLRDGRADVFDNNTRERYLKSHVPGARWVAFDAVQAKDLPHDKARTVVFYCANPH